MERRVPIGTDPVRLAGAGPLALAHRRLEADGARTALLRGADASVARLTRVRLQRLTAPPAHDESVANALDRASGADPTGTETVDRLIAGTRAAARPAAGPRIGPTPLPHRPPRHDAPAPPATRPARRQSGWHDNDAQRSRARPARTHRPAGSPAPAAAPSRLDADQASEVDGLEWLSVRVRGGVEAASTPLAVTALATAIRPRPARLPRAPRTHGSRRPSVRSLRGAVRSRTRSRL